MKEDKYFKGLCDISYARCSGQRFAQIYKALYGDAIVLLQMHEFIHNAWGTHKD